MPQSDGSIQAATCNQAAISDWNSAVAALQNQAGNDNQAAAQASASAQQQNISQAQQSLAGDVTSISQVKTDLSNVQGDLNTLQGLGASPGTDSSSAVAAGNKAL